MPNLDDTLQPLIGREVVLDMNCPFVYAGTLVEFNERDLVLEKADVHDLSDSSTTRERYVIETRQHGIRANRQRVIVRREVVVSLSALEDVIL